MVADVFTSLRRQHLSEYHSRIHHYAICRSRWLPLRMEETLGSLLSEPYGDLRLCIVPRVRAGARSGMFFNSCMQWNIILSQSDRPPTSARHRNSVSHHASDTIHPSLAFSGKNGSFTAKHPQRELSFLIGFTTYLKSASVWSPRPHNYWYCRVCAKHIGSRYIRQHEETSMHLENLRTLGRSLPTSSAEPPASDSTATATTSTSDIPERVRSDVNRSMQRVLANRHLGRKFKGPTTSIPRYSSYHRTSQPSTSTDDIQMTDNFGPSPELGVAFEEEEMRALSTDLLAAMGRPSEHDLDAGLDDMVHAEPCDGIDFCSDDEGEVEMNEERQTEPYESATQVPLGMLSFCDYLNTRLLLTEDEICRYDTTCPTTRATPEGLHRVE